MERRYFHLILTVPLIRSDDQSTNLQIRLEMSESVEQDVKFIRKRSKFKATQIISKRRNKVAELALEKKIRTCQMDCYFDDSIARIHWIKPHPFRFLFISSNSILPTTMSRGNVRTIEFGSRSILSGKLNEVGCIAHSKTMRPVIAEPTINKRRSFLREGRGKTRCVAQLLTHREPRWL